MSKKIFIVGTGTDVGKTYITGLIIKKLKENGKNPGYYKAAMSGNIRDKMGKVELGDALTVKRISGISQDVEETCPYGYEIAVSPHLAGKIENKPLEMEKVLKKFEEVCNKYDYITAEGSGGIFCPLRFDDQKIYLEDFIKAGDMDCILVADAGLGTINSVMLTVKYMESINIKIKGIIFNRYEEGNFLHIDNKYMCETLTGIKVIACVKNNDNDINIPIETLEKIYR